MSGPFEKYVVKAAEAIDPAAFDPSIENHAGYVRQFRRDKACGQARVALAAVGPLIQEDTRERMVAAAGAALEREGGGCAPAPITSREPEGKVLAALEKWYAEMDDDDGPFAFNYSSGQLMEASPESLKSLLETATKLGLELGRKEAAEEIAQAFDREVELIESLPDDEGVRPQVRDILKARRAAFRDSAHTAREVAAEEAS